MRRFVLGWKLAGHEARLKAHVVNYADDFVICCRGTAHEAMAVTRDMMKRLKLTMNEDKTHVRELPGERLTFWATRLAGTARHARDAGCSVASRARNALRGCVRRSAR